MPSNEQQQQQQQTVVTNHDVVSRPNDADSVVHYYRTITVISTLLINGGCLCVIISIIALAVLDYFGVICDLMGGTAVVIVGGVGIGAARRKTGCMINSLPVVLVYGMVFTGAQVLNSAIFMGIMYEGKAAIVINVLGLVLGTGEIGLSLWCLIICCKVPPWASQPTASAEPNEPEQVRVFIPEQPQQPTEPLKPPRYSAVVTFPPSSTNLESIKEQSNPPAYTAGYESGAPPCYERY